MTLSAYRTGRCRGGVLCIGVKTPAFPVPLNSATYLELLYVIVIKSGLFVTYTQRIVRVEHQQ